jgi:hypothetical protein
MMNTNLAGTATANPLLLHSDVVLPDSIFFKLSSIFYLCYPKLIVMVTQTTRRGV